MLSLKEIDKMNTLSVGELYAEVDRRMLGCVVEERGAMWAETAFRIKEEFPDLAEWLLAAEQRWIVLQS